MYDEIQSFYTFTYYLTQRKVAVPPRLLCSMTRRSMREILPMFSKEVLKDYCEFLFTEHKVLFLQSPFRIPQD